MPCDKNEHRCAKNDAELIPSTMLWIACTPKSKPTCLHVLAYVGIGAPLHACGQLCARVRARVWVLTHLRR